MSIFEDIRGRLFTALAPAIRDAEDSLEAALSVEILFPAPSADDEHATELWRWNGSSFTRIPRQRP